VFVDGFSLPGATEAAEGDGLDPDDVLDLLEMLVDKSLVMADLSGATARFRMLEATRHYAREKLKASGETGRDRLAAQYLSKFYQRAEATWPVTPTDAWLEEFGPEVENLRAAIDWAFGESGKYHAGAGAAASAGAGDPALGITLVACAGSIAEEMSLQADMKRWTRAALAHVTPATPPAQAGWLLVWSMKWDAVFGVSTMSATRLRAIELFREAGDVRGLSTALRSAAMAIAHPGDMPQEVAAMLAEAIALLKPLPPSKDLAVALGHWGTCLSFAGDQEAARRMPCTARSATAPAFWAWRSTWRSWNSPAAISPRRWTMQALPSSMPGSLATALCWPICSPTPQAICWPRASCRKPARQRAKPWRSIARSGCTTGPFRAWSTWPWRMHNPVRITTPAKFSASQRRITGAPNSCATGWNSPATTG
jgi:hypothetical protein